MWDVDRMLDQVLRAEGGFVEHPADRGGPTNLGITLRTLSRHLGRRATPDELRRLTPELAREIYQRDYYLEPRIDTLPERVRPFLFDCAVNHGPRQAVRLLQQVLNAARFGPVAVDGLIGPVTRKAAEAADAAMGDWLLNALVEQRRNFYRAIVAHDPTQEVFLAGWLARAGRFAVET